MLPPTRSNEGYRLLNQGLLSEAEAEFKAALQSDPKDTKCLLGLVRTQLASGQLDDALSTVQQVFEFKPDHLEARSLRGRLLIEKGDHKGLKDLEDAAKDRRAGPSEHVNYGLYLAEKDDAKAQKEFELALRVDARNMRAHLELAKIAERRGDYRNAVVKYQKACEFSAPNDGEAYLLLSRAHYALGETTAGSQAMLEAINRATEQTKAQWLDEGYKLAFDAREFQAALTIAVAALELNPDEPEYQKWRDEAQAAATQVGNKPRATGSTELWQEATVPPRTGSHNVPAQVAAPVAAAPVASGAPLMPEDACKQAEALLLAKNPPDTEGALRLLDAALAINPEFPKANLDKALALGLSKQYSLALQYAQRVQASKNQYLKAEADALVAKCQEKLRR
ncbi:MAG: tetratricopeptide repeat protein [Myxococcota bacterium]|nr:tetratricopeptide repeat protein [Myxococcota bacterium]